MKEDVSPRVRARIAEKLHLGTLTRERPRVMRSGTSDHTEVNWWIGSGPADTCDACNEPINEGQIFEGFRSSSGVLRMHEACSRCWEEERHKRRQPS
jgi:hypothetical protein